MPWCCGGVSLVLIGAWAIVAPLLTGVGDTGLLQMVFAGCLYWP